MDVQTITDSLSLLRKLEAKKYELECFRTEIDDSLKDLQSRQYKVLQVPPYTPPQKPINPNVKVKKLPPLWLAIIVVGLCIFFAFWYVVPRILFALMEFAGFDFNVYVFEYILLLSSEILIGVLVKRLYKKNKNNRALVDDYNAQLLSYEESKAKYDLDYENNKIFVKNNNEKVQLQKEQDSILHNKLTKTLCDVTDSITIISQLIDNLYNLVNVFPKYRNLIAISSISEYFESGRCSSLSGNDGAYNLYEQEIRQNLIIQELDLIIEDELNIKNNQYYLYQTITKTNAQIDSLSLDLCNFGEVLNNVGKIAALSADYAKEAYKIASEPKTIVGFVG